MRASAPPRFRLAALAASLIALAQASPLPAQRPSTSIPPLTLSKAIELAVASNPGLAATRIRGSQIQAMLQESKAPFLPSLSMNYSWNRGDWPHIMFAQMVDAHSFPQSGSFNYPGTFTVFALIGEARLNLWNGGRDLARKRMVATAVEISGTEQDVVRNALTGEVIESYYDILAAEARLLAARQLVESLRVRLAEQKERVAEGAILSSELREIEARLAEAEAGVVHVDASRARSAATLAVALGLSPVTDLAVVEDEGGLPSVPENLRIALDTALAARPEIAHAQLMSQRFEKGVDLAKADFLPRVDTYISVGFYREDDPIPEFTRDQKVWYANAVLSWEIFDGGAKQARKAKARAELEESRALDLRTTLAVELDVKNAWLRMEEARAEFAAAKDRLAAAQEARDVRVAQHEAGAVTAAAALESEQLLTDARMKHSNASFEMKKAAANIGRALGTFAAGAGPRAACCGERPKNAEELK